MHVDPTDLNKVGHNLVRNEELLLGKEMQYDAAVELRCADDFVLEGDILKVFIGTSESITEVSGRIVELFTILYRLPTINIKTQNITRYEQGSI